MTKRAVVRPVDQFLVCLAVTFAAPATVAAQPQQLKVQTAAEAFAQDAAQYAQRYSVPTEEALRRLKAQEESVASTDQIRRDYADRLAGISIEHQPSLRIVVLLTGSDPVPSRFIPIRGTQVPVVFRTGARASRIEIVAAMLKHRVLLDRELPDSRGFGLDQRTGELVLLVTSAAAARLGADRIRARAEAVTGVPVRIEIANPPTTNLSIKGGARLEGDSGGRRYACTTGFVVENGDRRGILTAAHCPDSPTYIDPDGTRVLLEFGGHWGVGHQDVQLHVSPLADRPLFYANRLTNSLRELTTWRNRTSLRTGDFVCKWGESSLYSCAEVQLTDYAPPGALCGGPCKPMWVTMAGPHCRGGDSGGPVFLGTTAIGITKGGSGITGRCNFSYFMSVDFLPDGWTLLHRGSPERSP